MFYHLRMNLAFKKMLGQFTKVLGFGKTPPPPCWEKFPNNDIFLRASLIRFFPIFNLMKNFKGSSGNVNKPTLPDGPCNCESFHKTQNIECNAFPSELWISAWSRLQRWSFFYNDGMVIFFFQGTIATDGFSMVLPSLDHHHWMFFLQIDHWHRWFFNGFSQIQVR